MILDNRQFIGATKQKSQRIYMVVAPHLNLDDLDSMTVILENGDTFKDCQQVIIRGIGVPIFNELMPSSTGLRCSANESTKQALNLILPNCSVSDTLSSNSNINQQHFKSKRIRPSNQ